MTKTSLSRTRLTQFHQMQSHIGGTDFDKAMEAHRAPTQLRLMTWGFSKVVNVAMAVAGLFHRPTRGDLSLLEFELMALGYFMPVKAVVDFDMEVVKLADKQKSILIEMHKAGLLDQPDENHPLVIKYVEVVNEAEALVQQVHAAYRQHVTLAGI